MCLNPTVYLFISTPRNASAQSASSAPSAFHSSFLPHHALPHQNRLRQSIGHHLIAIDQRQEESQVLLGAAQVVAQGGSPFLAVALNGVLKEWLLEGFFQDFGGVDGG